MLSCTRPQEAKSLKNRLAAVIGNKCPAAEAALP